MADNTQPFITEDSARNGPIESAPVAQGQPYYPNDQPPPNQPYPPPNNQYPPNYGNGNPYQGQPPPPNYGNMPPPPPPPRGPPIPP